jgi:hypothetical protein
MLRKGASSISSCSRDPGPSIALTRAGGAVTARAFWYRRRRLDLVDLEWGVSHSRENLRRSLILERRGGEEERSGLRVGLDGGIDMFPFILNAPCLLRTGGYLRASCLLRTAGGAATVGAARWRRVSD